MHAMQWVQFLPQTGLAVFQTDVVQGAQLHALTAADAGVRCRKASAFTKKR